MVGRKALNESIGKRMYKKHAVPLFCCDVTAVVFLSFLFCYGCSATVATVAARIDLFIL